MASFLGICNTSPARMAEMLVKKNYINTTKELLVVPVGTVLPERTPKKKFIFVIHCSDLFRNMKTLNSTKYKNVTVFVFASPIRLSELTNITLLDLSTNPEFKGFGFSLSKTIDWIKLRTALRTNILETKKLIRDDRQHLTILTDSVKEGSLLTPLMTFIYSLPNSTLQQPVKLVVARIIAKRLPISKLNKEIKNISGYTLTDKAHDKLVSILDSKIGLKYRKAFVEYYKQKKERGSVDINGLAKKQDVTSYEMRYILSVLDNQKKKTDKKQ